MAIKLLLLLAVSMSSVLGFFPTQESGKIGDYSHQSITERALYESAAVFIRTYINAGNKYASRSGVDVTVDFIRGGKLLLDYLDQTVNRTISIIRTGYVIFCYARDLNSNSIEHTCTLVCKINLLDKCSFEQFTLTFATQTYIQNLKDLAFVLFNRKLLMYNFSLFNIK